MNGQLQQGDTNMAPRFRLGIDIGGTFTDATLIDEENGDIHIGKVSTTPRDPSRGFMDAATRLLERVAVEPTDVRSVVHGTTVATNAIIEGKVACTGFITTEGFRDMLEIARQVRPSLYDPLFEKPRPLVPRHLCWGVPERLDAQGKVLQPLDETAVRRVAEQLRQENVESVAVCLLHSYVNPEHEQRIGALLREVLPDVAVSLSAEVAPEFREYLRASTTVINACIRPVVASYLAKLEARLREARLHGSRTASENLLIMQSSGGVMTSPAARDKPVFMVESGPAAGVMAATHLCNALGFRDALSFDMGGTTAKAGLIRNGSPRITKDYEVGLTAQAAGGSNRSAGYPIRTPVIDLVEVGAGGGSIAWVDSGGMLRVGPESVGADPGPACYGKGGTVPTITDANLVLGRLNPQYFLGGEIVLDVDRARKAIADRCAGPLGMDVVQAAQAIVEIANASMVKALRLVSVQRGYDPRDFVLIAFGGAGPVHANRLAAEIDSASVLIPPSPGTTSALGLLVTDLKHDYSATLVQRADRLDPAVLAKTHRSLLAEGEAALHREGVAPSARRFLWQVEMRYIGQSFELAVSLPDGPLASGAVADAVVSFHQEHERAYGYCAPVEPVEWVNLRLTALGAIPKPQLRRIPRNAHEAETARKSCRPVFFAEATGYVDCPVYDRYRLGNGCMLEGPAIVEEMDSTTTIHPGFRATVDPFGNLHVKR
jgi:N-methylhydantoinase A